jgi:catechol 2,3-dioxygenase-like lactoylglutathione lyase family enzyme
MRTGGSALLALVLAVTSAAAAEKRPSVVAVDAPGFTVANLDAEVAFFTDVLTFREVSETETAGDGIEQLEGVFGARVRVARLALGDEALELTEYLAPAGRPIPGDAKSNDHAFQHVAIVVRDMDAAYARLRAHHVTHASSGPQRLPDWNPNAGGIQAFYFKDPEGHVLEILSFPDSKGDPKWHRPTDALFLGIDHTAIVVSDTDASLALYRDVLGLRVAGGSENWGIEQERLNNVFGARLRITTLRAARGPGIEFLEYLAPSTGRPAPADLAANDLAHWQTKLVLAPETMPATAAGFAWSPVSAGAEPHAVPELGITDGLLVRDRDGHGLLLMESLRTASTRN